MNDDCTWAINITDEHLANGHGIWLTGWVFWVTHEVIDKHGFETSFQAETKHSAFSSSLTFERLTSQNYPRDYNDRLETLKRSFGLQWNIENEADAQEKLIEQHAARAVIS